MNALSTRDTQGHGVSLRKKRPIAIVLRIVLALLFCAGLFFSCFPLGRATLRSAFILPSLLGASQPAPLIIGGDAIQHTSKTIPAPGGPAYLDIYQPVAQHPLLAGARSGVLIIPGVGDNRQDAQLINLSEALARAGLVVMDMTTPTLINYSISVQDTDATVRAFQTLQSLPGMARSRSGIIAFSGGVPLACFAAADARVRAQVAYLAFSGGYFQTENVIRAFGQRQIPIDGKQERWQPTIVPLQTIANIMTTTFTAQERTTIINAINTSTPLTASDLSTLSPGAQAAYHLLVGDEPGQVDANLAALPPDLHALLAALSPSRVLAQISAPVYLLHDRNDTSLPVSESRAFAAALARSHHAYDYVEFHIFDHVEMRSSVALGQLVGDGSHLYSILNKILVASS